MTQGEARLRELRSEAPEIETMESHKVLKARRRILFTTTSKEYAEAEVDKDISEEHQQLRAVMTMRTRVRK